jgi:hypothetical protein
LTLTDTPADVFPAKLESPLYTAVTVSDPVGRADVGKLICPAEAATVPRLDPLTRNVTVPDGVRTVLVPGKIWAVNVTVPPAVLLDVFALSPTVVPIFDTIWVTVFDDVVKLPDGLYWAVMVCVPTDRVDTWIAACCWPATVLRDTVPSGAAPSKKVTLPVGAPDAADTVAVNVTDWLTTDGPLVPTTVVVPTGAGWLTVWVTGFDRADALNDEVAPYWALMVCDPDPRVLVDTLAVPFVTVPDPIGVPLS